MKQAMALLEGYNDSTNPIGILNPEGYERINRVYWEGGYSPCVTSRDYKDPIRVLIDECGRNKSGKTNR